MIASKMRLYNMEMCDSLEEIVSILNTEFSGNYMSKISKESTRKGRSQLSPHSLNSQYSKVFKSNGFVEYCPFKNSKDEIDFFKDGVGVEIQFGKYAYVMYDIFSKLRPCTLDGTLKFGVEVIPTKNMYDRMSTGVANFDAEVVRLDRCSIDFPLAVIGIEPTKEIESPNSIENFFE